MPRRLATIELAPEEIAALLGLVRTRAAEVERMIQGLAEGEGMDLQRHNAAKTLEKQEELWRDLAMKLEGASKGAG